MPDGKNLPLTLYVGESRYGFIRHTVPPPGFGTADASANQWRETAVIQGRSFLISDNLEDFPDGSVIGFYRLEETKMVRRVTQVQLSDPPAPEGERR